MKSDVPTKIKYRETNLQKSKNIRGKTQILITNNALKKRMSVFVFRG